MKLIFPGMQAHLSDGSTVHVVGVLSDAATGRAPSLVLATHGLFGADVVAPLTAVWHVDRDVHLALTPQEAAQLPHMEQTTVPPHARGYLWWSVS